MAKEFRRRIADSIISEMLTNNLTTFKAYGSKVGLSVNGQKAYIQKLSIETNGVSEITFQIDWRIVNQIIDDHIRNFTTIFYDGFSDHQDFMKKIKALKSNINPTNPFNDIKISKSDINNIPSITSKIVKSIKFRNSLIQASNIVTASYDDINFHALHKLTLVDIQTGYRNIGLERIFFFDTKNDAEIYLMLNLNRLKVEIDNLVESCNVTDILNDLIIENPEKVIQLSSKFTF